MTAAQVKQHKLHDRPAPASADTMEPRRQWALALFDEIECGLILCDGQGSIHFANQAAEQELAAARLLCRAGETLRQAGGASGDLDTAVRLAAQRGRRSLVRLDRTEGRLMVSVLPFSPPGMERQYVLVMLGKRQLCSDLGLEMLATSYGLTLAERRVLAALVREVTPREIAAAHAVALSTVRTQISSIRSKLGTHSIDGLLLRAAEVPPVAGALRLTAPAATHAHDPSARLLAAA